MTSYAAASVVRLDRKEPKKNEEEKKKRKRASLIITIISLVACISCFLPLYAPYEGGDPTDDYAYLTGFLDVPIFNQAAISLLVIVMIPGIDILMDMLPSSLFSSIAWYDMKLHMVGNEVSGMTKVEHFLFIIGMICMSSSSWKSVTDSDDTLELYVCFQNCSTILTSCPLLSFLVRRSSTWSPFMCIFITLLVSFGPFLSSLSLCFEPTSVLVAHMNVSSHVIIILSAGLCLLNTLWSLYKSLQWEQEMRNMILDSELKSEKEKTDEEMSIKKVRLSPF